MNLNEKWRRKWTIIRTVFGKKEWIQSKYLYTEMRKKIIYEIFNGFRQLLKLIKECDSSLFLQKTTISTNVKKENKKPKYS